MAQRAFSSLIALPDREIAAGVPPILQTLDALRVQASAGREIAIDTRVDCGLPIFARVASLIVDAKGLTGGNGRARVGEAQATFGECVAEALDTILLDKRTPSPIVEGQMKRAEYTLFLAAAQGLHEATPSRPVYTGDAAGDERPDRVTWSLWDATKSCPVRYLAAFDRPVAQEAPESFLPSLERVARSYDSLAFPLSAIASAIDSNVAGPGIIRLSRFVYGPLYSPVFMSGAHPLLEAMTAIACDVGDFVIEARREDIDHDGEFVRRGLFSSTMNRVFTVDASRPDCAAAGATRIVRHLVAPHRIAQRITDDPALAEFVRLRRVYALGADGSLTR